MDCDCGNPNGRDGVPKRDAGVGVSGGVEDDRICVALGRLDPGYQLAFQVGLPEINICTHLLSALPNLFLDIGQGISSINLGLPSAQQVQVGPVEKQDFHGGEVRREPLETQPVCSSIGTTP